MYRLRLLSLPVWAVMPRLPPSAILASDQPADHWLVYCNPRHATAAGQKLGAAGWQLQLIHDEGAIIVLVADMHRHGVKAVCLNAEADGSAGTLIRLGDLLQQVRDVVAHRARPTPSAQHSQLFGEQYQAN